MLNQKLQIPKLIKKRNIMGNRYVRIVVTRILGVIFLLNLPSLLICASAIKIDTSDLLKKTEQILHEVQRAARPDAPAGLSSSASIVECGCCDVIDEIYQIVCKIQEEIESGGGLNCCDDVLQILGIVNQILVIVTDVQTTVDNIETIVLAIQNTLNVVNSLVMMINANVIIIGSKLDACCATLNSKIDLIDPSGFTTIESLIDVVIDEELTTQSLVDVCCETLNSKIDIIDDSVNTIESIVNVIGTDLVDCCATLNSKIDVDFAQTWTILANISGSPCSPTPITSLPFTISVPGSYCLTQNAIPIGVVGITIMADNVTLDLNNYTITGATDGVLSQGNNIIIKNGRINSSANGIEINAGGVVTLENLQIYNCTNASIDVSGVNTILLDSCETFSSVVGINVSSANNVLIQNCWSHDNISNGVLVNSCNDVVCQNSEIVSNGLGINIDSSAVCVIENNNIFDNDNQGIYSTGSTIIKIKNCEVMRNILEGIYLNNALYHEVQDCILIQNGIDTSSAGILIDGLLSSDNNIDSTTVMTSGTSGILLDGVVNISIVNCISRNNSGSGIELAGESSNSNYVENCHTLDNAEYGILNNGIVSNIIWNNFSKGNSSGNYLAVSYVVNQGSTIFTYGANLEPF